MNNSMENFGCMTFSERMMRERLPKDIYRSLCKTMREGRSLDPSVAEAVANAMKDWAISKGATHFTHWFQPMTGITAEKHDSFIAPSGDGGVIMDFSGKELIKGEPDASSFPSGGLRATFEARGYTVWDSTSYAFIKGNTLCIPTAFSSFGGQALDKKTPLLRSMECLNKQAKRFLRALGREDVRHITATVGAEQEYFLIDKKMHGQRRDLRFCGRTLVGAPAPKGQEMNDHYFGIIRPRVQTFMDELNAELWKMGVLAKTEHNETAPAQHELAPIYSTINIACDHNQLIMETMKRVADRHDLYCLLNEKPFAGINGSGKHNNWALCTHTGENLLDPTDEPENNLQFLMILAAIIKAVDEHQDLLRLSVATAGNDHRLGGHEAPPAIVSIFLGAELESVLDAIMQGTPFLEHREKMHSTGLKALPDFRADTADRNRTSPFAFTGNKFEFRMPGSSLSIAGPNFVMNTIFADAFGEMADALEGSTDIQGDARKLLAKTLKQHKRIIFNGNNYAKEWIQEAKARGLSNFASTAEALPHFTSARNIALFEKHHVLTGEEIHSRCEIMLENYCMTLRIESLVLQEMVQRDIAPAVSAFIGTVSANAAQVLALCPDVPCEAERALVKQLCALMTSMNTRLHDLADATLEAAAMQEDSCAHKACFYRDRVFVAAQALRAVVDEMETMVDRKYWPMPTYGDLLYSV